MRGDTFSKGLGSHVAVQGGWPGLGRRPGGGWEALVADLRPTSCGNGGSPASNWTSPSSMVLWVHM